MKFKLHVLNCLREVCVGNLTRVRVYGVQFEVARQCVYVCVCVCLLAVYSQTYIYVCVCVCIYIYIYIYIFTHTHMYLYINIYMWRTWCECMKYTLCFD